jgi:hypothetical protein
VELLDEFVLLFSIPNDIHLSEEKDTIAWRWTTSGEYSVASAYAVQFLVAFPWFKASSIWQAKTEPKCQFFCLACPLRKRFDGQQPYEEKLAL